MVCFRGGEGFPIGANFQELHTNDQTGISKSGELHGTVEKLQTEASSPDVIEEAILLEVDAAAAEVVEP